MRILITGICGFVGSTLAIELIKAGQGVEVFGMDNLSRPGSELNRQTLKKHGIRLVHGDIRSVSDLGSLPSFQWIIDAAANPSVLAGVDNRTSSLQLTEHNLIGTINLLELSKKRDCGFTMISTSRVYSLRALTNLPLEIKEKSFIPRFREISELGLSGAGISETFSTSHPVSLYGASKLASEVLALEYGAAFNLPVYINRCGVLAGAGQFGRPDQGIVSFWIHSYCRKKPLKYIGFGATGYQVRDCLHPRDLVPLLWKQIQSSGNHAGVVLNLGGGMGSSFSLAQLSDWCAQRFGQHTIATDPDDRQFDVPWLVMDSSRADSLWNWQPTTRLEQIFSEITDHAEANPLWLDWSQEA
ncbi:MAG: NAD-dependent epimerase/dehydratase family protein [Acidobacteria bacterium]|nr:NAD-dependent epimerase/dehydratase family protein [Acidobacteriota bacterium]MBI3656240.1 NAD-dependent epimerase/dehydratase family protein [Acidobacteriota bacterium]